MSRPTTPNHKKDMDISLLYIRLNSTSSEVAWPTLKTKLQVRRALKVPFTATVLINKDLPLQTTRKERRFPNKETPSGNYWKLRSHLKQKLSFIICRLVLIAFFLTRKGFTYLEAQLEMVKHPEIYSGLTLTLYNGQNHNKKVPFQKHGNKLICHCTRRMTRIILFFMVAPTMKIMSFTQTLIFIKLKPNSGFRVTISR